MFFLSSNMFFLSSNMFFLSSNMFFFKQQHVFLSSSVERSDVVAHVILKCNVVDAAARPRPMDLASAQSSIEAQPQGE